MAFINVAALKPGAKPPPRTKPVEDQEYTYPELDKPVIDSSQRTPRHRPANKFLEDATVEELKAQIEVLQNNVASEHDRAETAIKERRSSNAFMSQRMMSAIVDMEQANKKDVESYERKILELEQVIHDLEQRVQNSQEQQPPDDDGGRGRAMSNYTQKMWRHLLDAESETRDYQDRIKELEKENEMLQSELNQISSMRGRSFTEYSQRMWKHLLEAEHETTEEAEKWKAKVRELEAELASERSAVKAIEASRRQSVSDVSRKMFRHLLNAEEDARRDKETDQEVIKNLQRTIDELGSELEEAKHMIAVERDRSEQSERNRAGSIKFLSNKRMKDIMDVEQQAEQEIGQWRTRVDLLEAEVRLYQQQLASMSDEFVTVTPGGPTFMGDLEEYDGNTPGGPGMTPGGPGEPTPGGDDSDLIQRIAELQDEVEYLRQSKMKLIQQTATQIDELRHNLTTMGQHVTRSRRSSRNRRSGWGFW